MAKVKTKDLDSSYSNFDHINGTHSFKTAVPEGFVDYRVRTRHGGTVFYFNFDLAREMGLISANHPNELTSELKQKIIETFSIVIINEYDEMHATPIREQDIRPNRYMATRYLQLQHPSKTGKTSGDGRGIWNGEWTSKGVTWDVSSSGTGATRLSPAHAQTKQFFKTGDTKVGYGNGYNCVNDGLSAAFMSEVFHQNGIETERTLAIISFEGGSSINVRASKNLFRPAHFFYHLKQNNYLGLKSSIDYFINRQIKNREWAGSTRGTERYRELARTMALTFSKIAAQYEAEYIFCWLDWDGDNILANGGIIDYGSVRQFGLYHHEYRYDDVDRMSTNIPEQRVKARHIVQNFAQIADFLITGERKPLQHFKNDRILKIFDRNFEQVLLENLLKKLGFRADQASYLLENKINLVRRFKRAHSYFEKAKSARGVYAIADGITCDAVFCMKDLHRVLPRLTLNQLTAEEFTAIFYSSYAKPKDKRMNDYRAQKVAEFKRDYQRLIDAVATKFYSKGESQLRDEMLERAMIANPENRVTGDGVLHITTSLIRNQKALDFSKRLRVMNELVEYQAKQVVPEVDKDSKVGRIILRNIKAIRYYRDTF